MAKHEVVCVDCGRRFDVEKEGGQYLTESRRYRCKRCVDAQKKKQKDAAKDARAAERERVTGMRQSRGAMIAKLVVAALFLISAFSLVAQGNAGGFVVGVVIAAALAAWALLPYFKAKKEPRE